MKTIRSIVPEPNIYGYITGRGYSPRLVIKPETKRYKPRERLMIACEFCKASFPVPPARLKSARFCGSPCRSADIQAKKRVASKAKFEQFE